MLDAGPDIYNHNMETVERLTPFVRSRAKYRTSLDVLRKAKELSPRVVTKSGMMLGLGEKEKALDWLDKSYQDQESACWYLTVDPIYDSVRNEPRFQALLKKVGLDQ